MMLALPLRLHPCRPCHGNSEILDRKSFRSDATLFFIYFFPKQPCLNDYLSCCGCGSVVKRVRERGVKSGAQPFEVRITPFRMSKGIMALLSPIILPWFQCLCLMPMNRSNDS